MPVTLLLKVSSRSGADASYRSGRSRIFAQVQMHQGAGAGDWRIPEQHRHPGTLGALLAGYFEGDALRFAGKVGTGFSQAEAQSLLMKLQARETSILALRWAPDRHPSWCAFHPAGPCRAHKFQRMDAGRQPPDRFTINNRKNVRTGRSSSTIFAMAKVRALSRPIRSVLARGLRYQCPSNGKSWTPWRAALHWGLQKLSDGAPIRRRTS